MAVTEIDQPALASLPWLEASKQRLLDQIAQQRLPHALLFSGPNGIGKWQLMRWLSDRLLCASPNAEGACGQCRSCLLIAAGSHPDLLILEAEKNTIGVDLVRQAIATLSETAHQQGARVVLINNAQQMTESAANALLKTLEEPGQSAFLLLSAPSAGQLVATITSRCQEHLVALPDEQLALQWLQQQGVTAELSHLRLNGGAPLRTKQFIDQQLHNKLDAFLVRLLAVVNGEPPAKELIDDAVADFPASYHWLSALLLDLQKVIAGLQPHHLMFSRHWTELQAIADRLHFQSPDWAPWLSHWQPILAASGLNHSMQWQAMLLELQDKLAQPQQPLLSSR
ncbi:DNA polymerase III subunit delta' [Neiella marina]|uniref:DNA-directed DNA polymerase n=1 Tax=Neiella marina TaxID=508461 RepID=A0A8J2U8K5_9GAMM|nr:DNA polymerase III subunit delta' [Neiella marina]GGA86908.1 DNA polymerase III subunit delta' [Neiella marina]